MKVKIMNRNESKKEIRVSEAQTPYTYALVNLMYQLHEDRFWGELSIRYKDGLPYTVGKSEQFKVDKVSPKRKENRTL
jgi:hypothetical protein